MTDNEWVKRTASEVEVRVAARRADSPEMPPSAATEHFEVQDGVETKILRDGRFEFADRASRLRRRPRVFANVELHACVLSCAFFARHPTRSAVVRNVRVHGGEVWSMHLEGTILDTVQISHLRWGDVIFARGARFRHVTLTGRLGALSIQQLPLRTRSESDTHTWSNAIDDYYREVDWALDIRGATFRELDIRAGAIPARLIRRDPATSAVVTRRHAEAAKLDDIDFGTSPFKISIEMLLESNAEDTLLVASRSKQRGDLEVIRQLREAGIADVAPSQPEPTR